MSQSSTCTDRFALAFPLTVTLTLLVNTAYYLFELVQHHFLQRVDEAHYRWLAAFERLLTPRQSFDHFDGRVR